MKRLFLDLDGVFADYDSRANEVLETEDHYRYDFIHGASAYWGKINERAPNDFFLGMKMLPNAMKLWEACSQHRDPVILTALPRDNAESVRAQKMVWVSKHFGNVPVVCCSTYEKPNYCIHNDTLVDDRSVNQAEWEKRGGLFILHSDAEYDVTIEKLVAAGVLPR